MTLYWNFQRVGGGPFHGGGKDIFWELHSIISASHYSLQL